MASASGPNAGQARRSGRRQRQIVRAPPANAASFAFVRDQVIGIVVAMSTIFLILLVAGYFIAARWAEPQLALFRASRDIAQGDYGADVTETGASETRATMRNLGRIARSFDRLETARRTWLSLGLRGAAQARPCAGRAARNDPRGVAADRPRSI